MFGSAGEVFSGPSSSSLASLPIATPEKNKDTRPAITNSDADRNRVFEPRWLSRKRLPQYFTKRPYLVCHWSETDMHRSLAWYLSSRLSRSEDRFQAKQRS